MAFGSVRLIPGVNVEQTPTLNQAGVTASQFIRYKDSLIQKYGGWILYFTGFIAAIPRDLHGWLDLREVGHLSIGSTTALQVITNSAIATITPQTLTTNFSPNFSTVNGQPTVTVVDSNIANVTTYDAIFFNTPVSVGGIVLSGLYPIASITGTSSYTITAAMNATSTVNNGGAVPQFSTTLNSSLVNVTFDNHNLETDDVAVFSIPTTGNGVTIFDNYTVVDVISPNEFTINATTQANASGSFNMNSGDAQLVYYINLGPPLAGQGWGLGAYGSGAYGYGTAGGSAQTGNPITASDWTTDNWGEILMACPEGGGVYQYDPTSGFTNAGLVATAPPFNTCIFISTTEQILVCCGSTVVEDLGVIQDPLLVQWSDVGDYTDFTPTASNQAGNYRIPSGSKIVAGVAVPNQNLIFTDLDVWAMNYIGPPDVFGFTNIGAGAGAISSHSVQKLRGSVYWMGNNNFFSYTSNGVAVIPCPVWDAVFQNLNTAYTQNIRAMPNTPFNEVGWLFPSSNSTSGECDSYVKFNITEPNQPWDIGIGVLSRSAWIDQGALGMPISVSPQGNVFQQETTNDAAGAPITASFQTGYFYLAEGEDYCYVDQVIPDFIFSEYSGGASATIFITFLVANFPSDTPTTYGPYQVTSSTEYISTRFRGRLMAFFVESSDTGSFWRIGLIKYRYGPSGRR